MRYCSSPSNELAASRRTVLVPDRLNPEMAMHWKNRTELCPNCVEQREHISKNQSLEACCITHFTPYLISRSGELGWAITLTVGKSHSFPSNALGSFGWPFHPLSTQEAHSCSHVQLHGVQTQGRTKSLIMKSQISAPSTSQRLLTDRMQLVRNVYLISSLFADHMQSFGISSCIA